MTSHALKLTTTIRKAEIDLNKSWREAWTKRSSGCCQIHHFSDNFFFLLIHVINVSVCFSFPSRLSALVHVVTASEVAKQMDRD